MVALSPHDRRLLFYSLRPEKNPGPRKERLWLGWPSTAYRVVVALPRKAQLNAIQRTVLGMLRCAFLTPDEMGQKLGLHPELCAFVLQDLFGRRLVDDSGKVTPRGERVWEEEHQQEVDVVPGIVFRDPWTGKLWPYLADSMEYAPTDHQEDYPRLALGSTGSPYIQRVYFPKWPEQRLHQAPDSTEIIRVTLEHQRRERRRRRMDLWDDKTEDNTGNATDALGLVSVDDDPEPVRLVIYLYRAHGERDRESQWRACDFFGFGDNVDFARLVDVAEQGDHSLRAEIDRWLGQGDNDRAKIWRAEKENQKMLAQRRVQKWLTADVQYTPLWGPLGEMAAKLSDWERSRGTAFANDVGGLLAQARTVTEQLFVELTGQWNITQVPDQLPNQKVDAQARKELVPVIVESAAKVVGFLSVPDAMRNIKVGDVVAVARHRHHSKLTAMVVACVLAAKQNHHHPFHAVAQKAPEFLHYITTIADICGRGVHHSSASAPKEEEIYDCITNVVTVVGSLLELPAQVDDLRAPK